MVAGSSPIVGRAPELAQLQELLDALARGNGTAAVVTGEAGIGKSSLLEWLLGEAAGAGLRRITGRQDRFDADRPFGTWVSALAGAAGCEVLVARLTGGELDWRAAMATDRFRLVDELTGAVRQLAENSPLLVCIDDLQWADELSRAVLSWVLDLTDALPLGLVLATRPAPDDAGVTELQWRIRRRGGRQLDLAPLDRTAQHELVIRMFGAAPGPTLDSYLAGAGGNPFLLTEILAELQREQVVTLAEGRAELSVQPSPSAMHATVQRHLSAVGGAAREALELACVLGDSFSLEELAAVSDQTVADVWTWLRPAMDAVLVADRAGTGLQFRHDLIRETLYDGLAAGVRRSLHGHVGRVLARDGADPLRVARHLAMAATPPDPEAAGWLRRAAHQVGGSSPATAVRLLREALVLVRTDVPASLEVAAELVTMLTWDGQLAEARALAEEQIQRAADADVTGRLRLGLGIACFAAGETASAAEVFVAASQDPSLPEPMRACLTGYAAWLKGVQLGDAAAGLPLAAVAVEQGRRLGEPLAELFGLMTQATLAYLAGDLDAASRLGADILAVASGSGSVAVRQQPAHVVAGMIEADRDERDLSLRILHEGRRVSEENGARWNVGIYHWIGALRHYLFGEWNEALAEIDRAARLGEELGANLGWVVGHATAALIQLHRGALDVAARHLDDAQAHLDRRGPEYRWYWVVWARALLLRAQGNSAQAAAALTGLWHQSVELGVGLDLPLFAADLARLLVAAGDHARVRAMSEQLAALPAHASVPSVQAAALHCAGLAARDATRLERAHALYVDTHRVLWAAAVAEDLGRLRLADGGAEPAAGWFRVAMDGYRTLDARHDVSRLSAQLRAAGLPVPRPPRARRTDDGRPALTPAERRVTELAARGLSNPEIAGELFLSRRTVESHLSSALRKLNLKRRAQLAHLWSTDSR